LPQTIGKSQGNTDFDGTGTISQSEYSMLQTIPDGKTCDETTWQWIKDEFETIEGEIFQGVQTKGARWLRCVPTSSWYNVGRMAHRNK
jgi:hypothetical protein